MRSPVGSAFSVIVGRVTGSKTASHQLHKIMHKPEVEPVVVESPLSQRLTRKGVSIQVDIYDDGEGKWILEVVDVTQTSHVWDEHFETDQEALAEAIRALEEEPMEFMPMPRSAGDMH